LKNQDPTDPVKNEAFVAQLAQFSQLEATTAMKTSMESLVSSLANDRMLGATSLIGKTVGVPDGPVEVTNTTVSQGTINVPTGASGIQLQVFNDKGILVRTQIMVAAGEKLPFVQRDIQIKGHSIECRINAEDPYKFTPSPGRITTWHTPGGPGVRVDSHIYANYFVPPNYDSMIGKIIVHGDTREQALARMRTALAETVVEGINTNIALHRELMVDAKFMDGGTNIHYLEEWLSKRIR